MPSQFTEWVALLKEDGQGGLQLPSIQRGQAYAAVLSFSADYSADSFTAYVDVSPNSGSDGTAFTVSVGSYSGGVTPVTISLSQAQVDALPADSDVDGVTWLVYEIRHDPAGASEYRIAGGEIPISESVY